MDDSPKLFQGNDRWRFPLPRAIAGLPLRYLLTTLMLEAGRPVSVRELVVWCAREGVVFQGRPSKVISDSLRWEIRRGRVMRLRRGIYRATGAAIPRSTRHWIAKRVGQLRVYLAAVRAQAIETPWRPQARLSTLQII